MREGKKIGKKSWCQIVGMGVSSTLVIIGRSESQQEKFEGSGHFTQSEECFFARCESIMFVFF